MGGFHFFSSLFIIVNGSSLCVNSLNVLISAM